MTGSAAGVAPTTPGRAIEQAVSGPGSVSVEANGTQVDAEVTASGPVGVRLYRLRVRPTVDGPVDLHRRASGISDDVRPGGERLDAVEVDPGLGGGVLRTTPDDIRGGRYYEVGIRPGGEADVRRLRVDPSSGERLEAPFDLTRQQLEELVDGLAEAGLDGSEQ